MPVDNFDDKFKLNPRYSIIVNDKNVETDISTRVLNVDVDLDLDRIAEITLTVDNHDFKFTDHRVFAETNIITVLMGYGNNLIQVASGEVVSHEHNFPRDGMPTLRVVAQDILHRYMDTSKHQGKLYRKWGDSKIMKHLIKDHMEQKPDVEKTEGTVLRIQKKEVSDYQELKRIALLNDFYIKANYVSTSPGTPSNKSKWIISALSSGEFHKLQVRKYSFVYNNNSAVSLLDFRPQFAVRGQINEVEVIHIDKKEYRTEKTIIKETKVGPETYFSEVETIDDELKSGASVVFTAFQRRIEVISWKKFEDKKDAKRFAKRFLESRLKNFINAEGSVVGTPDLQPGEIHFFSGMGARLDGEWELTNVRHSMSADRPYETQIRARKVYSPSNPKSGPAKIPIVPRLVAKSFNDSPGKI